MYGLGIVLPRLLNYVLLTPFYTRVFDRATYGIITELYAYVVFLLVILTYGMETGYFRFASSSKENGRIYTTVLQLSVCKLICFYSAGDDHWWLNKFHGWVMVIIRSTSGGLL